MRPVPRLIAAAALCLCAAGAQAAVVARVDIRVIESSGLAEAMATNVRGSLSLVDAIGKDVSGRRLAYLVRLNSPQSKVRVAADWIFGLLLRPAVTQIRGSSNK